MDPVVPHRAEVGAGERVLRKHVREQAAPAAEAGAENHPHGPGIERAHAGDLRQVGRVHLVRLDPGGEAHLVGEDKVAGADRCSVAPARFAANVVGEREWRGPRPVDMRDEVRPQRQVGTDAIGAGENRAHHPNASVGGPAALEKGVQAGRLPSYSREHHRAAAPRCLRTRRAARTRDGDEERGGERRG